MSYSLAVWYSTESISAEEASDIYNTFANLPLGQTMKGFPKSPYIDSFIKELEQAFVEDDWPWAGPPVYTNQCAFIWIDGCLAEEVWPIVMEIADKYNLICYDAEWDKVILPSKLGGNWRALLD